jgi:hypothetical protein
MESREWQERGEDSWLVFFGEESEYTLETMNADDPSKLRELRVVAAKYLLGLTESWEIPPIADRLLTNGVYSDALAELFGMKSPTMPTVGPLLEKAIAELHLVLPSKTEAAWYLADHCIRRIISGAEEPYEPLLLLKDVTHAIRDVLPNKSFVGDCLDVANLIGLFWSYSSPNENYYEAEQRFIYNEGERRAILDKKAREESRLWLVRHPSITQLPDDNSACQ